MGPPAVTTKRSRIRWVVVTEVKLPGQAAAWLVPPETVIVAVQMMFGEDPSEAVTANSTSMEVDVTPEKSNEADHTPDEIDSSAAGSSEKKQTVRRVVRTAVRLTLPCVVFMPLAREQPVALGRGPVSCRKNREPARSNGWGRASESGCTLDADTNVGAATGIVMSPTEDQSVASITICGPLPPVRGGH